MRDQALRKLVDRLYQKGINLEEAGQFYSDITDHRFPGRIDEMVVESDTAVSEDVQDALTYLAAQFHYAHIAELVISGRIIEHSQDIPAKRLGVVLCISHVSYADMWGNYLAVHGQETTRNPVLEEHFRVLFDEQQIWNIIIGLCVIGAISGRVVMEATQEVEDLMYSRTASFISEAKYDDERMITMFLDRQLDDINGTERQEIRRQADVYRDHAVDILLEGKNPYPALDLDKRELANIVGEQVNTFYKQIGIEESLGD